MINDAHQIDAGSSPVHTEARQAWHGALEVIRRRPVAQLMASEAIFDIGTLSHTAAMAWVSYELTGSTLWVGTVAGIRAVPSILLPILGGGLADRFDRRKVIGTVRAFQAVVIAVQAVMIGFDAMQPWEQAVFAVLSGCAVALSGPAIWAILSSLVEPHLLPRANAILTLVANAGEMTGPVLAGITISSWGPEWLFGLIAATYAVGAYMVLKIPMPKRSALRREAVQTESIWLSVRRGLQYARRRQPIPWLFVLIVSTNIFGAAAFPIIPDYAHVVFANSGMAYGLMFGMFGLGMLTGSAMLLMGTMPERLAKVLLVSSLVWDVSMVIFAFSTYLPLTLVMLYVMGVAGMFWVNAALILLQRAAPGHMRGRVMSIYTMAMGLFPLGWLYGGAMAAWVGAELTLVISALLGTPVVAIALARSRVLRSS